MLLHRTAGRQPGGKLHSIPLALIPIAAPWGSEPGATTSCGVAASRAFMAILVGFGLERMPCLVCSAQTPCLHNPDSVGGVKLDVHHRQHLLDRSRRLPSLGVACAVLHPQRTPARIEVKGSFGEKSGSLTALFPRFYLAAYILRSTRCNGIAIGNPLDPIAPRGHEWTIVPRNRKSAIGNRKSGFPASSRTRA